MKTRKEVLDALARYKHLSDSNKGDTKALETFLDQTAEEDLYRRTNYIGHITASAFVVDTNTRTLLLLHHKKLNRWLQPGGHVDAADPSLFAAASRETLEETGLGNDGELLHPLYPPTQIFDVNSHAIPENTKKHEPAHVHHDIRFLFSCPRPNSMLLNAEEALGFKWVPLEQLSQDPEFGSVALKIIKSLA